MKTLLMNTIFLGGALLGSSVLVAQGMSYKNLTECKNDYAEIIQTEKSFPTVEKLPPGVYLARSVTQSFEMADNKYFSYQTLLEQTKTKPDLCFAGTAASKLNAQSFVPTVIDLSPENKWGNTFWSFSASLDKQTGAIDSKRSLIPNEDYKKALEKQGFKVTSHQKSHNEYSIKLERSIASWKETVVISYDQF